MQRSLHTSNSDTSPRANCSPTLQEQVRNVKERLRAQILRNELPDGARLVEQEIKERTGATHRAVRKALVELAHEGILDRRRHVGTFVVQDVQLRNATPILSHVGVLTSLARDDFERDRYTKLVMTGIREGLQAPGTVTLFANPPGSHNLLDQLPPMVIPDSPPILQGVIAIEANHGRALNELVQAGTPVVGVDFCPPGSIFDAVVLDHHSAGYQATANLLALGHRKIGFIGEAPNSRSNDPTWQQRVEGYLYAMAEVSGSRGGHWILDIHRTAELTEELLPVYQREHRLTAYVLSSGTLVSHAMKALGKLNLDCPKDISLTAADATHRSFKSNRFLSTIVMNHEDLGRSATRLLTARLASRSMPQVRAVIPVTFLPGDSSAPCTV